MKRFELFTLLSIAFLIGLTLLLNSTFAGNESTSNQNNSENNEETKESDRDHQSDDDKEIYWGVDSASYTDEELMSCVVENFGQPQVWGRYLGDIEGVSEGLDANEVKYLNNKDVKILVIYNHAREVTNYNHGVDHAEQAINLAENVGATEGVAFFLMSNQVSQLIPDF
ncbi:hypothetical protein ACLIA0_08635 [Bacillaceae bacterium W0354]